MPNVFRYSQHPAAFTESAPGRTSQTPPLEPLTAGDGPSLQSRNQLLFPFIAFHKINIDIYYAILLISINVFLNYFYFFIKKKHLIGTLLFQLTWSLTPHSPTAAFAWVCRTTNHLDFNIGRSYI